MPVLGRSNAQQYNLRSEEMGWTAVCDDRLAFESAELAAVLELWRSAAGAAPVPRRADLSTALLKPYLPDISMIDYVEPEVGLRRYRFRFQGRNLARLHGDLTGQYLDAVIPPTALDPWNFAFDTALRSGGPLRFVAAMRTFKLTHLKAESLVAPFADVDGVPAGLLSALVYSEWDFA